MLYIYNVQTIVYIKENKGRKKERERSKMLAPWGMWRGRER